MVTAACGEAKVYPFSPCKGAVLRLRRRGRMAGPGARMRRRSARVAEEQLQAAKAIEGSHSVAEGDAPQAPQPAQGPLVSRLRSSTTAKDPAKSDRRVRFASEAPIVHEVTAYSEIYGIHPRDFVFDRHAYLVPSGGDFGFVDVMAAALQDRQRERYAQAGYPAEYMLSDEEEEMTAADDSSDEEWFGEEDSWHYCRKDLEAAASRDRLSSSSSLEEAASSRGRLSSSSSFEEECSGLQIWAI